MTLITSSAANGSRNDAKSGRSGAETAKKGGRLRGREHRDRASAVWLRQERGTERWKALRRGDQLRVAGRVDQRCQCRGGGHYPVGGHPAYRQRTAWAEHGNSIPHENRNVQDVAKCK
jgi:hypothetical protein